MLWLNFPPHISFVNPTINTVKILKVRTPEKIAVNILKNGTVSFYYTVKSPKDADRMANSVDPDQTAPLGSV